MKITNVKMLLTKGLAAGLLAGAVVMAAPAKAEAQRFQVGVRFGAPLPVPVYQRPFAFGPAYQPYAPVSVYEPGFYDRGWDRHEVLVRHGGLIRDHDFHRDFHGR